MQLSPVVGCGAGQRCSRRPSSNNKQGQQHPCASGVQRRSTRLLAPVCALTKQGPQEQQKQQQPGTRAKAARVSFPLSVSGSTRVALPAREETAQQQVAPSPPLPEWLSQALGKWDAVPSRYKIMLAGHLSFVICNMVRTQRQRALFRVGVCVSAADAVPPARSCTHPCMDMHAPRLSEHTACWPGVLLCSCVLPPPPSLLDTSTTTPQSINRTRST